MVQLLQYIGQGTTVQITCNVFLRYFETTMCTFAERGLKMLIENVLVMLVHRKTARLVLRFPKLLTVFERIRLNNWYSIIDCSNTQWFNFCKAFVKATAFKRHMFGLERCTIQRTEELSTISCKSDDDRGTKACSYVWWQGNQTDSYFSLWPIRTPVRKHHR